jgi:hypothetical protein
MANAVINNTLYDVLKQQAQVTLPGLGTLYFALSQIWGMPYGAEVVGTITAVDAFLGLFLGYSSKKYKESDERFDGEIVMTPDEENGLTDLNVSLDHEAVASKDEITVKINKNFVEGA